MEIDETDELKKKDQKSDKLWDSKKGRYVSQ